MDVIIFCGQSNMQGQSEMLTSTEAVANAYEYKFLTNELCALKNPVGEDITFDMGSGYTFTKDTDHAEWINTHIAGSSCYGFTNLVPSFCREYVSAVKRCVTAVHIAKGSTTINYWLPSGRGYDILVRKSIAAIEKVMPERIFFVWLQGESDAIEGKSKEIYKKDLQTLCTALKKDIGIEKFAIIRVGRFTNDERDIEIMSAQDEICRENKNFLMLTDIASELCENPEYMNPFVRGHYGAKGLEKLGKSAGSALAKYINGII